MSSNIVSEDPRSIKTEKALYSAMFTLLRKFSFRKVTIKEICEEALISRATFYTHFVDKYDLLEHWISELWPINFYCTDTYEQIEKTVNNHIQENTSVFENLVCDADNETFGILFGFILSTMNLSVEKNDNEEIYHKNIVLSNFYAGGVISYLLWQVRNKFPSNIPLMNRYFYEIIREVQDRQSK